MFIRDFNKQSEKSNKIIKSRKASRDCRKKIKNFFSSEETFAEFIEAIEKNNYVKMLMAQFREFY